MTDKLASARHAERHSKLRLRFASGARIVGVCASMVAVTVTNAANAAPSVRCVVVRKPTTQQREQSAADVERLLDQYETKTNDSTAWPLALAELFDRFPLPSVNVLMALHHPAWTATEQKLGAYLEATRQDPTDYADPAAVAQTIRRIEETLLPEVQRGSVLVIEARGVVRRQDLAKLDLRIDGQSCSGELVEGSEAYSVSWTALDRRLSARATPQPLTNAAVSCVAIDGDQIGPCDGQLTRVPDPTDASIAAENTPTARPSAARPSAEHPSAERVERVPSPALAKPQTHPSVKSASAKPPFAKPFAKPPSIDYALALPGLALAAAGLTVAVVARAQVESHMDRAERGPEPQCQNRQCTPAGMADVLAARDWTTGYYIAGVSSLLGLGVILASGHRYYAHWLASPSKPPNDHVQSRAPSVTLVGVRAGAGVLLQSRF